VLGEDVHLASGTVFSNFTDANITEGVEPAPPGDGLPSEPLIWTMDFNVNPMTAVMWVVRGDRAYARDEIVLRHSHVEETVREMQRRWPLDQWPGQTVIPDATGGGRNSLVGYTHHDALRLAGYKLKFRVLRREQDAINASRRMICDAAGVRRVFIDRRCVKLLHSVKVWAYERDSNKTREKEYADDERNYFVPHLADCFKYLFWNLFPISKPSWRI